MNFYATQWRDSRSGVVIEDAYVSLFDHIAVSHQDSNHFVIIDPSGTRCLTTDGEWRQRPSASQSPQVRKDHRPFIFIGFKNAMEAAEQAIKNLTIK